MEYSEDQLIELAKNDSPKLIIILSDPNQDNVILTLGIEALTAECKDQDLVFPVLKKLLNHRHALVREGALIGVGQLYDKICHPDILNKVKQLAQNDPHLGIKATAKDILENY